MSSSQKQEVPIPFWHHQNPWKDMLVYVPIEELAECSMLIGTQIMINDKLVTFTKADVLRNWVHSGARLDAYILNGKMSDSGGVRYGPELDEYLSPSLSTIKLRELRRKYL